jgi:putative flippase GtrA
MSATIVDRRPPHAVVAQLVRYGLVGVTNTALTLGAYAAFIALGAPAPLAAALSWSVGAINGYLLNRTWTFRSDARGARPAARYAVLQLAAAGLDALAVGALVGDAHLAHMAAEVVILPAVTLVTFAASRRWVFAEPVRA